MKIFKQTIFKKATCVLLSALFLISSTSLAEGLDGVGNLPGLIPSPTDVTNSQDAFAAKSIKYTYKLKDEYDEKTLDGSANIDFDKIDYFKGSYSFELADEEIMSPELPTEPESELPPASNPELPPEPESPPEPELPPASNPELPPEPESPPEQELPPASNPESPPEQEPESPPKQELPPVPINVAKIQNETYLAGGFFVENNNIQQINSTIGYKRKVKAGDYYLIDLPSQITTDSLNNISGSILDESMSDKPAIANYSVENGKIKVVFANHVENSTRYNITGQFSFTFNLDNSQITTDTPVSFPIEGGSVNIKPTDPEIEVDPDTTPTNITKKGTYDDKQDTITWTVELDNPSQDWIGYTFNDTVDTKYMTITSVKLGDVSVDATYYNVNTGVIEFVIPGDNITESDTPAAKIITIETTLTALAKLKVVDLDISNTAKLVINAKTMRFAIDTGVTTLESTATVKVPKSNWITKDGVSLIKGNSIQWTIKINVDGNEMTNAVITDALANLELAENGIKVKINDGELTGITVHNSEHIASNSDEIYATYINKTIKIYLPRTTGGVFSKDKYEISIETRMAGNVRNYSNTAYLTAENPSGDVSGEGKKEGISGIVTNGPDVWLMKDKYFGNNEDGFNKENGTLDFLIYYAANQSTLYNRAVITDVLPKNVTFVEDSLKYKAPAGNFVALNQDEYTVTDNGTNQIITITLAKNKVQAANNKETVGLPNDNLRQDAVKDTHQIMYQTKINDGDADVNKIAKTKLRNTATIHIYDENNLSKDNDSDYEDYYINNVVDVSKTAEAEPKVDGKLRVKFTIKVEPNLKTIKELTVKDDLNNIKTKFGDKEYSDLKWTYVDGSATGIGTNTAVAYDSLSNLLTFNLNNLPKSYNKQTLTFIAELIPNEELKTAMNTTNGKVVCSNNTATVEASSDSSITSKPANDVEFGNEILKKEGSYDKDGQKIDWSFKINQSSFQMSGATVVDELVAGLVPDMDSVKLYNYVNGNKGASVDVKSKESTKNEDTGAYTVKIGIPDTNSPYLLEFSTYVDSSLSNKTIENIAYYEGQTSSTSNKVEIKISSVGAGGSQGTVGFSFVKTNENGEPLKGVEFSLFREGQNLQVITATSDVNGQVKFGGLKESTVCILKETKTPDGYIAMENIIFVAGVNQVEKIPEKIINYKAREGVLNLVATKTLEGKKLEANQFSFGLYEKTSDTVSSNPIQTVKNDIDGKITFAPIKYTMKDIPKKDGGGYTDDATLKKQYVIKEIIPEESAEPPEGKYDYDKTKYTVDVEVKYTVLDATLAVTTTINEGTVGSIIFNNKYTGSEKVGEVTFEGTKELVNTTVDKKVLKDDEFQFEVHEANENYVIEPNKLIQTVQNAADGKIKFAPIKYSSKDLDIKAGASVEGFYVIKEVSTDKSDIVYDKTEIKVKVTITNTAELEKFDVKYEVVDSESIKFTNQYSPKKEGLAQLGGTKTLNGRTLLDGEFSFGLYKNTTGDNAEVTTELIEIVTNKADGKITFKPIKYTLKDLTEGVENNETVMRYTIKEISSTKLGYVIYDTKEYDFKVKVKNIAGEEALNVEYSMDNGGINFTNRYVPPYTPPEVTPPPTIVTLPPTTNPTPGPNFPDPINPNFPVNPPQNFAANEDYIVDNITGDILPVVNPVIVDIVDIADEPVPLAEENFLDIFDEEVPLDGREFDIFDEDVPLGFRPVTSDEAKILLYGAILVISGIVLVLLKKQKDYKGKK